ncbi:Uncharacterised protein [Mycobacterium tuberculosis]|nr:Uncharacterised protein [Mycobacterium tuberculosis]
MAAEALGVAGAGSAGSACPAGSRVAKQQAALPAVAALTAEAAHPLDGAIGRPAQATGTADAAGAEGKRARPAGATRPADTAGREDAHRGAGARCHPAHPAVPTGAAETVEQPGAAAVPAGATGGAHPAHERSRTAVPTGPAGTAIAPQQTAASPGAPVEAVAAGSGGVPAGSAGSAIAPQPSIPAIATGLVDPAGPTVAAVAVQNPAVAAVLARTRQPVGAVADQRTPQQRLGGRIDQVEQILLNRLRGCRLSDGVGVTAGGEGPDKLFMKHRRLGTQRLICPSIRPEQRGYGRRYLVAAGCDQCRGRCRRGRVGCTNRRTDVRQICCRRCDQLRHHDEIGHQGPPASWKPGGRPVTIEPSAKAIAIAPTRPAFPRDLPCVSPVRLGTFQPGSARSARWPRRLGRRCVSEFAKCRVGTSTVDGGRSTVHQDGDPDGLSGFLRCSAGPYRGLGV